MSNGQEEYNAVYVEFPLDDLKTVLGMLTAALLPKVEFTGDLEEMAAEASRQRVEAISKAVLFIRTRVDE